jgi:eukaryotic-like serine/threonine-protein kinase
MSMHPLCLRLFVSATVLLFTTYSVTATVTIKTEGSPLSIHTASYDAQVETDGCLTNLRIKGHDLLAAGVGISRGSYFFQDGALKLPNVKQESEQAIEASSELATIRYEFAENEMNWKLTNASANEMVFFIVFSKVINAALVSGQGAVVAPLNQELTEVSLVAGDVKLSLRGCDKLWGPWQGPHQVCQVTLKPNDQRTLSLTIGSVSLKDKGQLIALQPVVTEPDLQVFSPRAYQVFQRSTAVHGALFISGHTTTNATQVRVSITGQSIAGPLAKGWRTLAVNPSTGAFEQRLPLPAGGWYELKVEALRDGAVIARSSVKRFGIGEVFVGAGQSNSTNCGELRTQQETGMVSSFGGTSWQLANDPQPGVADNSQGGSFWPAFGDAMYRQFGVPIGIATTGYGGTSVNQWQPEGDLFPWMMTRIHQLGPGGFRALLWHQGESDVEMPTDEYYAKLKTVIQASRQKAGWYFPWFVAQASYHSPDRPRFESVRSAQGRLWKDQFALPGPDTDLLVGDNRDLKGAGIHFSPKGLSAHGQMWANCVSELLTPLVAKSVTVE